MDPQKPPPVPSFKRILVPTDFSACAEQALDYAIGLARALGAEIQLCHCGPMPDYHIPGLVSPGMREAAASLVAQISTMVEAAQHEMDALVQRKVTPGVSLTGTLIEGYPDEGIARRATEWSADLIVIGSHGRRGLSHVLLGSAAERVLRSAPCPVLVVHSRPVSRAA